MALERTLKMRYIKYDDTMTMTFNNVNPTVSYQVLNTAMRKIASLANIDYLDTYVVDTQSLNNIVEGENDG